MGVVLLATLLLGWWFQPFVVETRREDGSLRRRFELRRDWRGRRVSHGTQSWYLRDGTRFTRSDYDTPLGDDEFESLLMPVLDFNSPAVFWFSQDNDMSLVLGGGQTLAPEEDSANLNIVRPDASCIDELQTAEEPSE